MANIEASLMKGERNWALLLDEDGFITEGTGDNFFIVKKERIITPEGRNILGGFPENTYWKIWLVILDMITRKKILNHMMFTMLMRHS